MSTTTATTAAVTLKPFIGKTKKEKLGLFHLVNYCGVKTLKLCDNNK